LPALDAGRDADSRFPVTFPAFRRHCGFARSAQFFSRERVAVRREVSGQDFRRALERRRVARPRVGLW
jgi:hypothetical protein